MASLPDESDEVNDLTDCGVGESETVTDYTRQLKQGNNNARRFLVWFQCRSVVGHTRSFLRGAVAAVAAAVVVVVEVEVVASGSRAESATE